MNLGILEIISTRKVISIEDFRKAIVELHFQDNNEEVNIKDYSWRYLYYLDTLGHCEIDYENRKIYACNPTIALLPGTGSVQGIMVGARSTGLIKQIQEVKANKHIDFSFQITQQQRDNIILPEAIVFQTFDEGSLNELADILGVEYIGKRPIAWIVANSSGGLSEYYSLNEANLGTRLNWNIRTFDIECLYFKKGSNGSPLPQLIEYTHPITQRRIYLLADDRKEIQVEKDWGRYYILNKSFKNILLFDEHRQFLAVPSYVPLPKLLARAATLCSGTAARTITVEQDTITQSGPIPFDLFPGVDITMANLIAKKVGQNLIMRNLSYD